MNAENTFGTNDYVVYKGVGVCRVEAVENKTFDGKTYEDYLKLIPLSGNASSYFVPVGKASLRVRKPMSPADVDAAIDTARENEITLTKDTKQRKLAIESILKSNDHAQIIALIKTIYLHTVSCRNSGKKVLVSDENALRTAENMIYPEFSFVLGIDETQVPDYIGRRIESFKSSHDDISGGELGLIGGAALA